MRRSGLFLALCLGGSPAAAQTGPLVRWPEAVGFVALTTIVFANDGGIRSTIQGHDIRFRNTIADVGNTFGNPRYILPALVVTNAGAYATEWEGYGVSLDASTAPRTLAAFKLLGAKGHGFGGIYRIEGDELTVCLSFDRLGKPPNEFKSPAGSGVLLLKLKRSK